MTRYPNVRVTVQILVPGLIVCIGIVLMIAALWAGDPLPIFPSMLIVGGGIALAANLVTRRLGS